MVADYESHKILDRIHMAGIYSYYNRAKRRYILRITIFQSFLYSLTMLNAKNLSYQNS